MANPQRSVASLVLQSFAVAIAYVLFAKISLLAATIHVSVSPVWPATGLAIWAVYAFGPQQVVAVGVGAFLANVLFTPAPLGAVFGIALGNASEAAFGAFALRYFLSHERLVPFRLTGLGITFSCLLAPLVSATVGVMSLVTMGSAPLEQAVNMWSTWWVGDALGGLFVIPIALYLQDSWPRRQFSFRLALKVLLQTGVVCSVTAALFTLNGGSSFLFVIFPVLLFCAAWSGRAGLWIGTALIALSSLYFTAQGQGPFASGTQNENLMNLQLFLGSVALTAMSLEYLLEMPARRLSALTFLACWLVTGGLFYSFDRSESRKDHAIFEKGVDELRTTIVDRYRAYEDALRAGVALYQASEHVERDEWRRFANEQAIAKRYPGVRGYGVIWAVKSSELRSFQQTIKKDFGETINLKGLGTSGLGAAADGDAHAFIRFIEPLFGNTTALGVDVLSDPVRRRTLELARDTKRTAITEAVKLVQESQKVPGFVAYLPIFLSPRDGTDEPKAFVGWVFASFLYDRFFEGIVGGKLHGLEFTVFDADGTDRSKIVYSSASRKESAARFEQVNSLEFGQRKFTFGWHRGEGYVAHHDTTIAWVGLVGAVLSILLVSVVTSLHTVEKKSRAIAEVLNAQKTEAVAKLTALIEASPSGIVATDLDGIVTRWNSACERIFGWSKSEAEGRFLPFIPLNKNRRAQELIGEIRKSATPVVLLGERVRKDGTHIQTEMFGMRILSPTGQVIGLMGVINDVTEKLALENRLKNLNVELTSALDQARVDQQRASEATKIKSQFLANMSHELRTPLNGILGMSELMGGSPLSEEQSEYNEAIASSGRALLALVNDILDISKIEAGRLTLESSEFSLAFLFEDGLRAFDFIAEKKNIRLTRELDAPPGGVFLGDSLRLRQILTNLVGNAIKFTQAGSVVVRGRALSPNLWRFEVEDTGIGIPETARAHLFQVFSQADGSTTRQFGGTGLGLSISRQLVELMGGKIDFESREGQGSLFWFEIPLRQIEGRLPDAPVVAGVEHGARFSAKILVAEDNPINQKIILRQLERRGFSVETVGNGAEALTALAKSSYDLVLMDCQMPVLDGFEATRRVRAGEVSGMKQVIIVAMTANAMEGDRERCLAAGMNDYLAKPATEAQLMATIAKWIPAHEALA